MIAKSIEARWIAKSRVAAIDELFAAKRINRRQAAVMKEQYATPQRTALALSRGGDDGFESLLSIFGKPARKSGGNPVLADMDRRAKAATARRPNVAKQRR